MQSSTASWSFEAIGTHWQIAVYSDVTATKLAVVKRAVARCIADFDKVYSRFRADSLVTTVAQAAGSYQFPPDAAKLFAFYKRLYNATDGAVTPLIGQTMADAGYDATYSLQPKTILSQPHSWDATLTFSSDVLSTKQPVLLDFGAAGKGYLVDIVAAVLRKQGVTSFYVDAGGDITVYGLSKPLRVGLEHPADAEQVVGIANLADGAICGSAGNRRAWQGFTHIIDPHTLRSPPHISATWCMAADTMTADGIATALYFASPQVLSKAFDFEYCIVYADGTVTYSQGFKAGMFQEQEKVAA